jgi:hypothetical protein
MNKQFDMGQISGYIAYSMYHPSMESEQVGLMGDSEWNAVKEKWIEFLCSVRKEAANHTKYINKVLERSLHRDVGKARFWTLMRWRLGYLRVFEPTHEQLKLVNDDQSEDGSDDE